MVMKYKKYRAKCNLCQNGIVYVNIANICSKQHKKQGTAFACTVPCSASLYIFYAAPFTAPTTASAASFRPKATVNSRSESCKI